MAIRYKSKWKPDRYSKIPKTLKRYRCIVLFGDGRAMWVWHYQPDAETGLMTYMGKEIVWKPVLGRAGMIAYNIAPTALVPLLELGNFNNLSRVNFCWQKTDGTEINTSYLKGLESQIIEKEFSIRGLKDSRATVFTQAREELVHPQESARQHTVQVERILKTLGQRPEFGLPGRVGLDNIISRDQQEEEE